MRDILNTLSLPIHLNKPRIIIADTIKGKGVSFMEGNKGWHGVAPNEEDLSKALKELEE
jgi:transketolase